MVKLHHHCANMCSNYKNVSGTKNVLFWQLWEEWRNQGKCELRSVPEKYLLHSSYRGVVVSYDDVVVGIRGVEPRLKASVHSHGMRWTSFERRVSFDSRRAVSHWLLEHGCNVLYTRATVIRYRDRCKNTLGDTECLTPLLNQISVESLGGCNMWSGRVQRTLSMWRSILEETWFFVGLSASCDSQGTIQCSWCVPSCCPWRT